MYSVELQGTVQSKEVWPGLLKIEMGATGLVSMSVGKGVLQINSGLYKRDHNTDQVD